MHHIIVQIREARIVSRLAPPRMIGSNHAELFGPCFSEIESVHRAPAVEENERFAVACRIDDRLHAVDDVFFTSEPAHRSSPFGTAAARGRRRGMTSSANKVMFLTAFQCGMSATCTTLLMCVVFILAVHSPIWLATFSGVPTAMKNAVLMA